MECGLLRGGELRRQCFGPAALLHCGQSSALRCWQRSCRFQWPGYSCRRCPSFRRIRCLGSDGCEFFPAQCELATRALVRACVRSRALFKEANRADRYDEILKKADGCLKGEQFDEGDGKDQSHVYYRGKEHDWRAELRVELAAGRWLLGELREAVDGRRPEPFDGICTARAVVLQEQITSSMRADTNGVRPRRCAGRRRPGRTYLRPAVRG